MVCSHIDIILIHVFYTYTTLFYNIRRYRIMQTRDTVCVIPCDSIGSQMAERLGKRAIKQKVAGSIRAEGTLPYLPHVSVLMKYEARTNSALLSHSCCSQTPCNINTPIQLNNNEILIVMSSV